MENSPFPCLACNHYFPLTNELYKVCPTCRSSKYCAICKIGNGVHPADAFSDRMVCSKAHPSPQPARRRSAIPAEVIPATPAGQQALPHFSGLFAPAPPRLRVTTTPSPPPPTPSNQETFHAQAREDMEARFRRDDIKREREADRSRRHQRIGTTDLRQAILDDQDSTYEEGEETDKSAAYKKSRK